MADNELPCWAQSAGLQCRKMRGHAGTHEGVRKHGLTTWPNVGLSVAESARWRSKDIDERNRHGYMDAAALSGEHINHGIWIEIEATEGFGWEHIEQVHHAGGETVVMTERDTHVFPAGSRVDVTKYASESQDSSKGANA